MRGNVDRLEPVLSVVAEWAHSRPDMLGLAVVGSYARGTARPDSDLDLMLLARDPATLRADQAWPGAIAWDRAGRQLLSWCDADSTVTPGAGCGLPPAFPEPLQLEPAHALSCHLAAAA